MITRRAYVWLSAMVYERPMRPKLGRKPVMPLVTEGPMMLPPVSDPMAKGTQPEATAEPGPAEEPEAP